MKLGTIAGAILSLFVQTHLALGQVVPAASGPAPGPVVMTADDSPLSLINLLISGGWVMVPLGVASLIVVTLIIFYLLTLRESTIATPEMLRRMEPFFENEDVAGLASYVAERPQATARVLDAVLKLIYRHPEAGADAIRAVAEAEGSRIAAQLNQRALYVMDIGVLAPMLGLFGTVVGILSSFGALAKDSVTATRTLVLAGGVAQALAATAVGLIVGILSMAFYSFFRSRVTHLISLLEVNCAVLVQEIILMRQNPRGPTPLRERR